MENLLIRNTRLLVIFISLGLLISCWGCDGDGPTEPKNPPTITSFTADPANISPGDSTLLSYQVSGADSVKLFPDGIKLANAATGSLYVKPTQLTEYILVAYNKNGQASDSVTVIVASLVVLNGYYYKGEMGSDVLTPPIALQALEVGSVPSQDTWIFASVIEGDGTLAADSVQPGADDTAYIEYNFDGSLGHAVIRTWIKDIDTADLYLRAATIIPGDNFQGQYALYRDTYALIQEFYGNPAAVVNPEPGSGYLVLDYEPSDSIVFIVGEVGAINGQVSTMDTVYKILITGSQTAETAEGIAVGATYPELFAAYGEPQTSGVYPGYPQDTLLYYDSLGLLFWCNKADTVVNQIDLMAPDTPLSPLVDNPSRRGDLATSENKKYRLLLP
ncbi:MAG: hypothetical protein JXA92_07830 [candidate division Zixibacteria bacterium]|nr:hypothetical protein [candidate division Zixibacteria bacterium]